MIQRVAGFKLGKSFFLGLALIAAGGVGLYLYADRYGLSYRELIVVSALLIVGVIVFGRELGVRWGFVYGY